MTVTVVVTCSSVTDAGEVLERLEDVRDAGHDVSWEVVDDART